MTTTNSIGLQGLDGYLVEAEVHQLPGPPSVQVIGLPDAAVKESRERVVSALHSAGIDLPEKKIIIHLAPADQKKNGPAFDLAIAIALMRTLGQLEAPIPPRTAFLGALSLSGDIRPVTGTLPAVLAAKNQGIDTLYLPAGASLPLDRIEGIKLRFVSHLNDVCADLTGTMPLASLSEPAAPEAACEPEALRTDFSAIYGQVEAKRALEIAAAGGHHLLFSGPPGCGKSLLAESFPTLLPPLAKDAQLEVMSLYELAGTAPPDLPHPPFRSPHHTASAVSLTGGGASPKPGEISLAHHGVLFLDEMAEFPKKTLDMLRQPLEAGVIAISRVQAAVTYPARFQLLGAINPCPCGYLGARHHYCTCTPKQRNAYQLRLSGPVRDRFDLTLQLKQAALATEPPAESSASVRARVIAARDLQYKRYGSLQLNAHAPLETLQPGGVKNTPAIFNREQLSNRTQVKILRIARTIADLTGSEQITDTALNEALHFSEAGSALQLP
ncbi:magnesium chelatase family protein [Salsuginibacillus halophilus]|uniref:Magnesium chelatase family protein n=1 Tax=Salsuginibacillus halophilus TaxID=517424 RepID=A0A2P8HQC3_9BACI|nr:YifB family Mg chelatase-like AAA ATPase [Salsuginibacillus halophilus]PSL48407.1 magnesium chelatase family protein [Salsuginibacillus halophilus]